MKTVKMIMRGVHLIFILLAGLCISFKLMPSFSTFEILVTPLKITAAVIYAITLVVILFPVCNFLLKYSNIKIK